MKYKNIINFIKKIYLTPKSQPPTPKSHPLNPPIVPLHEPIFIGNEKKYLSECIDSTFVSSVGEYVNKFEKAISDFTGAKYAIAVVNGTSGLHIALKAIGVDKNSEVITQPLTFVATCNAISYCGAKPIFVDVDLDTLGMSPKSLKNFLEKNAIIKNGKCINKKTGKVIKACVPMHTFGHPCKIDEIVEICKSFNIEVVEDAAESLGSFYKGKHTGTFGKLGVISFNGNKIITTGGGGMVITNDKQLAQKIKHLTTTAKVGNLEFRGQDLGFGEKNTITYPLHPTSYIPNPIYEYIHDEIGYNYRMPNINAALGLAQMENLEKFLNIKRKLAKIYEEFFETIENIKFVKEPKNARSNYWLNTIIFNTKKERDEFLELSNREGVFSRAIWRPMHLLNMYKDCQREDLKNTEFLYERGVNIPSGVVKEWIS